MNGVFLDTAGLLALWNRQDQWHEMVRFVVEELERERAAFLTTSFVLLECGNAASRQPFRHRVVELRDELTREGRLVVPTAEDEAAAWAAYLRGEAGSAGIVDHVSFVVMRRLGLARVLTHNAHFRASGFVTLF